MYTAGSPAPDGRFSSIPASFIYPEEGTVKSKEEWAELCEKGKSEFDALHNDDRKTVFLYIDEHLKKDDYFRDVDEVIEEDAILDLVEIIAGRLPGFDLDARLSALRYAIFFMQRVKAAKILRAIHEPDDEGIDDTTVDLYAIERAGLSADAPLYFVCFVPEKGQAAYDDLGHARKFTSKMAANLFLDTAPFENPHSIHQLTFGEANRYCDPLCDKAVFDLEIHEDDLAGNFTPDNAVII